MKKAAVFTAILLGLNIADASAISVECMAGIKARQASINRQANQIIAEVEVKDRYQKVRFGEANLAASAISAKAGAATILEVMKDIRANKKIKSESEIGLVNQLCDYRFNVEATVY